LFMYSMIMPSGEGAAPTTATSLRIIPVMDEVHRGVIFVGAW
jgi:hypothetical protein